MSDAALARIAAFLRAGRIVEARRLLDRLPSGDPAVLHMAAIVLWREGLIDAARAQFAAAVQARASADWLANAADFEAAQGETDAATILFRRAISADPAAALPRRLRLALALVAGGRLVEAITELEALVRDAPGSPLAWQSLGAARRMADDVPAAAAAFARVLALVPGDPLARLSRAQIEADRGRPATAAYAHALGANPDSSAARIGLATAQAHEQNFSKAEATLRVRLTADPGWSDGWAALASLAHRCQGRASFVAVTEEALHRAPTAAAALAAIGWRARAGEHRAVLDLLPALRARWGDLPPARLLEAVALDETGDTAIADRLFVALPANDLAIALPRLRHELRAGRPDRAVEIAEALLNGPAEAMAWPYLGTAWRLLGDPRHQWLEGDARLVGRYDLGLSVGDLAQIAACLREFHHTAHAPFEQSMRNGTQTEGALLSRDEPEVRRLRAAASQAVALHLAQLPPPDPRHPTLRRSRAGARFAGSWSVRLTEGGHHVNHVHSEGWFSSACHLVVPADTEGGDLTLGEPPTELATGLAPIRTIAPAPGWLVLFPSTMWHGTTPFGTGERLTAAFDLCSIR